MKTSMMVIKPKALHMPMLMLLFHQPVQASYHRLCSGLMLINRVQLEQHSQTTFAPCILFHRQTGRTYSYQT